MTIKKIPFIPLRNYSEANPRAELREWQIIGTNVIANIYNDVELACKDGSLKVLRDVILHEYSDHYFVVQKKTYYLMYKRNKRKFNG